MHPVLQVIAHRIGPGLLHRVGGDIQSRHLGCSGIAGIQGKGSHMGKAVQHPLSMAESLHGQTVELLIQEKAGLLAFGNIDQIADAVLCDLHIRVKLRPDEAFMGLHALFLPDRRLRALIDAPDLYPVFRQGCLQLVQNHELQAVDAQRQGFHHQDILILIHHQARQPVCLPEDHPAGGGVDDLLSVIPGISYPLSDKLFIDGLFPAAGKHPDPDL